MAILKIPDENITIEDLDQVTDFLKKRGIDYSIWEANKPLSNNDSQEDILKAYEHELTPFMNEKGFKSADVISVNPDTENIEAIREKFLKEHTHSEDEVRFFVDGEGLFWFHIKDEVFSLLCKKGDFLSVPAGFTHWFDLAPKYTVKAIRIFTSMEGWVANYTNSGIDEKYNK
ncbi:MAG: 1,2-dihydroxy-3-keto-5-methylthiopentene dioxygenase [Bacteriovoracaceae bacterium]